MTTNTVLSLLATEHFTDWAPAPAPKGGVLFVRRRGSPHCVLTDHWLLSEVFGADYEWCVPVSKL